MKLKQLLKQLFCCHKWARGHMDKEGGGVWGYWCIKCNKEIGGVNVQ